MEHQDITESVETSLILFVRPSKTVDRVLDQIQYHGARIWLNNNDHEFFFNFDYDPPKYMVDYIERMINRKNNHKWIYSPNV